MEMMNMKMSKKEKDMNMPTDVQEQEYPYGLRIRLDDEQISKIGMKSMHAVGTKMMMMAMVEVKSATETDDGNGKRVTWKSKLPIWDWNQIKKNFCRKSHVW